MFFWLGILVLCKANIGSLVHFLQDDNGIVPDKAFEEWLRKLFGATPEPILIRIFGATKGSCKPVEKELSTYFHSLINA